MNCPDCNHLVSDHNLLVGCVHLEDGGFLCDCRKTPKEIFYRKVLHSAIMYLCNINTITPESQAELVELLRGAGEVELADMVAVGGFASVFNEGE